MSVGAREVVAVVPVRVGEPAAGGVDALRAADGHAVLVGSGVAIAAGAMAQLLSGSVRVLDRASFQPGAWAAALAPNLSGTRVVVLPASPDGRDLAPRLAAELRRPLVTGAVHVTVSSATVSCWGGRSAEELPLDGPCVVTLEPGPKHAEPNGPGDVSEPARAKVEVHPLEDAVREGVRDPEVLEVLAPDLATMDLSEAPRIVGAGAGLGDAREMPVLARVAGALDAAVGATRVVTDAGWIGHERQIGTTGVVVAPQLYLAFGVSGAVQHTAGLGHPEHIVAVNLDPYCPMMAMADLAVVADAAAVVQALAARLGVEQYGVGAADSADE